MTDDLYCLQGDDPRHDPDPLDDRCVYCGESDPDYLSDWLNTDELIVIVCWYPGCIEQAEYDGMVKR